MAGSSRSRVILVACAAALSVSTALADVAIVVTRSWSYVANWIDTGIAWAVSKLPRPRADWLPAWHRLLAAPARPLPPSVKRRPLICPRWRMCPSV